MYMGFRKCIYDSENVYRIQKMYNSIQKTYIGFRKCIIVFRKCI